MAKNGKRLTPKHQSDMIIWHDMGQPAVRGELAQDADQILGRAIVAEH